MTNFIVDSETRRSVTYVQYIYPIYTKWPDRHRCGPRLPVPLRGRLEVELSCPVHSAVLT